MANSDIITSLKQKIKSELVNDELFVKAIGSPHYDNTDLDISAEDVGDNYIFTWNQNPETITEVITFVAIEVNTKRYKTGWMTTQIIFHIYSHNDHMRLKGKDFPGVIGNRNDYIGQILDNKFNGRNELGLSEKSESRLHLLGDLELITNAETMFTKDFVKRTLIFETKESNNGFCEGW